jgi:hypothetical protein
MAKYLLIVDFQPGVAETSMEEWEPAEVEAHLAHYGDVAASSSRTASSSSPRSWPARTWRRS